MAVLSRAGCNAGACHGNLNGQGGLKLSLRGEDPIGDRSTLTRDMLGRRTDSHRPDESLLLQKATGGVPHVGRHPLLEDEPRNTRLVQVLDCERLQPDPSGLPKLTRVTVTPVEQDHGRSGDRFRVTRRPTSRRLDARP